MTQYAWVILLLPLAAFALHVAVGRRLPRQGDWLSTGAMACALAGSCAIFYDFHSAGDPTRAYHVAWPWLTLGSSFTVKAGFLVDNLTAVLLVIVTLVSTLVHLFSIGYMRGDKRYGWFFACLSLFSFSMLGIVLAESFFFIYVFWELVGLSSYLLIGFWFEKPSAADACKKAFLTTRVGDVGMFIGIMLLFHFTGCLSFDDVFAAVGRGEMAGTALTVAGLGIFCGAVGKSAQFPLHVWLPDAMEGPTPVSALIHAATMVAAGVYLVGRVYPLLTPDALLVVAWIGTVTLFMAATCALAATDIKRVLAYSTISQLGFMMLGLGVGGYTAGLAHLTTHAAFKACLFLGSGAVIHAIHSQELGDMGGLRHGMPITFGTFLIAGLALSGVPLFSGFYSKDMILGAALQFGFDHPAHLPMFVIALFTAGLTAFYMFRVIIRAFLGEARGASPEPVFSSSSSSSSSPPSPKKGKSKRGAHDAHVPGKPDDPPAVMWIPLVVLAGLSFSFWYTGWFGTLIVAPASVAGGAAVHAAEAAGGAGVGHAGVHAVAAHTCAMVASVVVATLGILFSFGVYAWRWIDPAAVVRRFPGVHDFLLQGWYLDHLYDRTFVAGALGLAGLLARFDLGVVDGLVNLAGRAGLAFASASRLFDDRAVDGAVNGVASVTWSAGGLLRQAQTGRVYHYVFVLLGGLLVIVLAGSL